MRPQLPVADGPHGRMPGRQITAGTQPFDFGQAGGHHGFEAPCEPLVQLGALSGREDPAHQRPVGERADRGALQFGDRLPGAQAHLECTLNALAVGRTDAGRGLRVALCKLCVQHQAQAPRLLIELLPQRR